MAHQFAWTHGLADVKLPDCLFYRLPGLTINTAKSGLPPGNKGEVVVVVVWVRGVCLHPLDSKHTVVSRTLSFVLPSPRPAHVWLSKHHWQSEGDPKEQEQVSGNGCEGGGGGGGLTDMGAARSNTMLFNHSTTAEDAAREQARQRERQATSLLKSHQPAATLIQNTVIICIQSDPHICPPISQPSQAGFFFFFWRPV